MGYIDRANLAGGRLPSTCLSTTYAAAGRIHERGDRRASRSPRVLRPLTKRHLSQPGHLRRRDRARIHRPRGPEVPQQRPRGDNRPRTEVHPAARTGPPPTTFRYDTYDTYDTSGDVAEPGSYAFLANPAETRSAVTTYEGLRDGSATALRIHATDADGVSRAAFLDTVEVGDLFEWYEADDCFVRYTVNGVTAGASTRDFAVKWMTYAFTGCSGAIATDATVSVKFGPLPNLGGTGITAPVVHGVYQIVPVGWTGATKASVRSERSTSYPPERLTGDISVARQMRYWRDPTVPEGWVFSYADEGGNDVQPVDGYCARWVTPTGDRGFQVCGKRGHRIWFGDGEGSWHGGNSLFETRVVAGRPATVIYSKTDPIFPLQMHVYDAATDVEYTIHGYDQSVRGGQVDAVSAILEGMFQPPNPLPPQTTFRYDSYDTTGEVAEPGSYAFLANPADTSSAVTTYEDLRDGTATALRIHEADADGVPRAAFLDTVEVGDLFEWRQAEDCWIRYQIELTPIAGTGATRDFGIRWITYAPTGCSGGVPATSASTMEWRPPDAIQSPTLTSPVRHGQYLLIPTAWDGPMAPGEKGDDPLRLTGILVEPQVDVAPPPHYRASIDAMSPTERVLVETSDPAEARRLIPLWRDPVLPEGWTLRRAEVANARRALLRLHGPVRR